MASIRLRFWAPVASVVLAALLAAPAGAALQTHSTPAGNALAHRALLHRGDLGRGWSASPAAKTVPGLTCPAFSPALSGVVQTGAAMSPTFQSGPDGPFVSQTAYAYASGNQEGTVWREVARPGLERCVAASLVHSGTGGVHFTVTGKRMLALPNLPVRAEGYRVAGTASVPNQTVNVYLDVLLLGGGTRVAEISFSSFLQPVSTPLELRLARTVARRMAAG